MPKVSSRILKIGDLIQRELSRLVQREMNDPRLSIVIITGVTVSRDLKYAKVFIGSLEDLEKTNTMVKVLNSAASYLRVMLAKRVELRVIPELKFIYDDSTVRSYQIFSLIDEALAQDDSHKDKEP